MTDPVLDGADDAAATTRRLLDYARSIRPELIERRGETETTTHIPEDLHRRFQEAGLYRMWIPRAHGGLETDLDTYYRVIMELARGDLSLAWCFGLSANHALMVANWFPAEVHGEIFDGGDFSAASFAGPAARATRTEGGYLLDGPVPFCSGIPWSTHFLGQARLEGVNADGSERLGIFIAPKGTYEIVDDWGDMHGLNGSGSNTIRFANAFLPERFMIEDADLRTFGMEGDSPGFAAYGNPMYAGRHGSSFAMLLAALVIGGGYGALDEFGRQMRTRTITVPPWTPRTEDPDFLRYFGKARVRIGIAEAALLQLVAEWDRASRENVGGGEPFTPQRDVLLAAMARELIIDVWEIVGKYLFETIGTSAMRRGERFEHIFRDLAQAASHRNPQLRDIMVKVVARQELGLE